MAQQANIKHLWNPFIRIQTYNVSKKYLVLLIVINTLTVIRRAHLNHSHSTTNSYADRHHIFTVMGNTQQHL